MVFLGIGSGSFPEEKDIFCEDKFDARAKYYFLISANPSPASCAGDDSTSSSSNKTPPLVHLTAQIEKNEECLVYNNKIKTNNLTSLCQLMEERCPEHVAIPLACKIAVRMRGNSALEELKNRKQIGAQEPLLSNK